jgi:hypothetical protein
MSEIQFFSEADMTRNKDGKLVITSEYPAWYNDQFLDNIREEIRVDEYNLESGIIPKSQLMQAKERIKQNKDKLSKIEASIPKLDGVTESKLDKARKTLAKNIQDRMFTRSQMAKGISDAHMEVKRMNSYDIPVDDSIAELAQASNVRIVDGKINREGATKIWKLSNRYFNEISNVEMLRRD